MKLYYSPLACSLADHIALFETGLPFEIERVDLHEKTTASGHDYRMINAKGYVPALELENGEVITENVAVLDWIADQYPPLGVSGPRGRTRLLEALAYIASELHPAFKPMWHGGADEEQERARATLADRFAYIAGTLRGGFLFGDTLSAADCYLFVMLRWAEKFGVPLPEDLSRLRRRMEARQPVQAALESEGLAGPPHRAISAEVRENPNQHRFERPINDEAAAAAYYRPENGRLVFIHTEVPAEFSGQGIGTDLARGTFELLRESGRKAVLTCPFMVQFFNKHPEYGDVVHG